MARPKIFKTSIDYWTVDLGNHFGIWESMENPKEFVNRLNAAIDEEVAAAVASATAERDKTIERLKFALEAVLEEHKHSPAYCANIRAIANGGQHDSK